ncbi:MAG: DNA repair protein RecN [Candidatus Nanopelagicales bacterium]
MIKNLRVKNLGLIQEVHIELKNSFVVLTGETGAGKTMLLSAIDALLGKKLQASLIDEKRQALVEAELDFSGADLQAKAKDLELDIEDDGLLISRSFSKDSKTRNYLGGRSVPAALISEITGDLIFIHGQKDQMHLTKPNFALQAVDRFGGGEHLELVDSHRQIHKQWRSQQKALEELDAEVSSKMQEKDKLQQVITDILEVNPDIKEDELLKNKINNLQNIEKIQSALSLAMNLSESQILTQLNELQKAILNLNQNDPEFILLSEKIGVLLENLKSLSSSAVALSERFEEIEDIDALENRRSKINRLLRLYGPTMEDVLGNLENAQLTIAKLKDPGSYREELLRSLRENESDLIKIAERISKNRINIAEKIGEAVTRELGSLMLPEAEFTVSVQKAPALSADHKESGVETIDFLFRSNKKLKLGPIAKIASGGELSRLMLAIEVVMAKTKLDSVMVFDEIDAGVGGKAAIEIARRLKSLSSKTQVIVVTHLAQVAAFAEQHLVIQKKSDNSSVLTAVKVVEGEARRLEISRMLAGLEGSKSALQHADELLALATGS